MVIMAFVFAGCGLFAPFDLSLFPDAGHEDADPDVDGDRDMAPDSDQAADADGESDGAHDSDVPCTVTPMRQRKR